MEDNEILDQSAEIDAALDDEETSVPETGEPDQAPDGGQETTETSEPQSAPDDTPAQEEPGQADQPAQDPPESFTLKHLDETRTVGKDEVVQLAQKGMDYDRIRTERDELRQYRQEADPALSLVKSYAQRNGMDIPSYIDYCRRQELMSQGVDEPTARAQVAVEKQTAAIRVQNEQVQAQQRQQEAFMAQARQRQEARQRDMRDFIAAYPGVKAETIPKEVWNQVSGGKSLITAWTMYQNQQLTAQLAAQKQNQRNAQAAAGSLAARHEGDGQDEIDRLWAEDD